MYSKNKLLSLQPALPSVTQQKYSDFPSQSGAPLEPQLSPAIDSASTQAAQASSSQQALNSAVHTSGPFFDEIRGFLGIVLPLNRRDHRTGRQLRTYRGLPTGVRGGKRRVSR